MINEYIILMLSIIPHELGHYLGYRLFSYKPNIKITWFGITIGENCYHKLTVFQSYLILLLGIGFGTIILLNVSNEVLLIYFLMSSHDIGQIIDLTNLPRKYWKSNKTLLEIGKEQIKTLEKKRTIKWD